MLGNSFAESSKNHKENIDIIHQGLEYRLSTSEETNREIRDPKSVLDSNKPSFVRVKLRTCIYFEFMEFSFTQTYSFQEANYISDLKYLLYKKDSLQ